MAALLLALGAVSSGAHAAPTLPDVLRLHNVQPLDPPPAAPPLVLPSLDGKQIALKGYQGHWVLLTFFATWCGPCASEMPSLQRLHESMQGHGLDVVAVAVDPGDDVGAYVRKRNLTFTVLLDTQGQAANAYQASSIPVTYLINPAGHVVGVAQGARDWQAASTLVDALLAAQPVKALAAGGPGPAPSAAPVPPTAPSAPAAPAPMPLPSTLVPPEATARLVESSVTVGEPFHVDVTVRWAGSLRDYVLLPPTVPLPASVHDLGTAATTNTEAGRATLVYRLALKGDVAEDVKLDPIEVRYRVAGQKEPLSRHVAGPTVSVQASTIAGQSPRLWALLGAALVVLSAAGVAVGRKRKRSRPVQAPAAVPVETAQGLLEQSRVALMNGDVALFLRGVGKILPGDAPQQPELAALLEAAHYGGQKPDAGTLDRLLRAAQRHVEGLAQNPQSRAEHHS